MRHLAGLVSALFVTLMLAAGVSWQAEASGRNVLSARALDRSILVREHAGWNRNCEAIAHPPLYLVNPPRHGNVCARSQKIRISAMYVGTESQCVGHLVSGVKLIYQPDDAYLGEDTLVYAVQYPSRLRTIAVKVTVDPHLSGNASVAEADYYVNTAPSRQMPGLIPDCPQFLY